PGWQKARRDNFNTLVSGGDADEDMVHDGWTDIFRNLTGNAAKQASRKLGRRLTGEERAEVMALADYRKMNQVRARVDAIVGDPDIAASLKPWYRQFCKRPCFHDEYLQTYNRPNVHLIDTQGMGVEGLTEKGVIANGREYELDCLIFATGFEVGTSYTRRAGYDIVGRGGQTLSQHWGDGIRTLHGLTTTGFPNCFFLGFTQTAITISVPQALNEQADHVAYMVSQARDRGVAALEPTAEAEDAYVQEVRSLARMGQRFYTECTPGYYNSEGQSGNRAGFFSDMYGAGPIRFFQLLAEWRADGRMEGLALR
ncbi:MAG TPA: monooxygenase, partial [Caulobacteraceae bacterium]|nr:monooxygenase [Caulobacteraceae bacterium]